MKLTCHRTWAIAPGVFLCLALPHCSSPDVGGTVDGGTPNDANVDVGVIALSDGSVDAADTGALPDLSDESVACEGTPCVVELAAGSDHFCARMSDKTVRCWGANSQGELGRGAGDLDDGGSGPAPVIALSDVRQISAGLHSTCAVEESGEAMCWGANDQGQLGLSDTSAQVDDERHPTPAAVALPASVSRIDIDWSLGCAAMASGEVYCWGSGSSMPFSTTDPYTVPTRADIDVPVKATSGTFALTQDGQLLSWGGANGVGREISTGSTSIPQPITSLNQTTAFVRSGCAIASGKIYCWGQSTTASFYDVPSDGLCVGWKRLGGEDVQWIPAPVWCSVPEGVYPQQITLSAPASPRTCVRFTDGSVQCCGSNVVGQMGIPYDGDGGATMTRTLAKIPTLSGYFIQVKNSVSASCALTKNGAVKCWGGNSSGELGQGTSDDQPHPAPLTVAF